MGRPTGHHRDALGCIIIISSTLVLSRTRPKTSGLPGIRSMLSFHLRTRLLCVAPLLTRRLTRWSPRPSASGTHPPPPLRRAGSFATYSTAIAFGVGVGYIAYENYRPFRHTALAVVRCSRVAGECMLVKDVLRSWRSCMRAIVTQRRPYLA